MYKYKNSVIKQLRFKSTLNIKTNINNLFMTWLFLITFSFLFGSELVAQNAKTEYESAKKEFENGNTAGCLSFLEKCQASLGGSNAKIEALKCQALMMNADWVNAAIAFTNYERLVPISSQNGEAYMAMLDNKKEIWQALEAIEKKKKEEIENEIKEDLAAAETEEEQQENKYDEKLTRINKTNESELYALAAKTKDKEMLELYKSEIGTTTTNGAKIELEINKIKNPSSYLHVAAKENNVPELNYLLSIGAELNFKNSLGETLIHTAIRNDAYAIYARLLELKVDIEQTDTEGNTPLIKAILKIKPEFVNLLLKNGANPQGKNTVSLQPPFYYALINSYANFGETLIKKGVDPNEMLTINGKALTPLYIVANKTQSKRFTTLLINNGANIDKLSANGLTPLMAAVNNKDQEFVNFLLNNEAIINTKGKDKRTALHLAVVQRDAEMVKYLIQRAGASKKIADDSGKTPLQLAKKMEDKTIAKTIIRNKSYVKLSSEYSVRENQYLKEVARRAAFEEKRDSRKDRYYVAFTYDSICTYGISGGTINNNSIGYYFTLRSNDNATLGGPNGTVDNNGVVTGGQYINWGNDWRFKNKIKTGTTEFLLGLTKKIAYPLWIYAGAGVSYNNVFWEMDIYDNLGDYFVTDWVENREAEKFNPVYEAGLIIDLKGFNLRGGMKTKTLKDMTFTVGIGFSIP